MSGYDYASSGQRGQYVPQQYQSSDYQHQPLSHSHRVDGYQQRQEHPQSYYDSGPHNPQQNALPPPDHSIASPQPDYYTNQVAPYTQQYQQQQQQPGLDSHSQDHQTSVLPPSYSARDDQYPHPDQYTQQQQHQQQHDYTAYTGQKGENEAYYGSSNQNIYPYSYSHGDQQKQQDYPTASASASVTETRANGDEERGLGATLVGGAGGAFLGHSVAGGGLGTLGGMVLGAIGANLLENKHEKHKREKKHYKGSKRYDDEDYTSSSSHPHHHHHHHHHRRSKSRSGSSSSHSRHHHHHDHYHGDDHGRRHDGGYTRSLSRGSGSSPSSKAGSGSD